MLDKFRSIKPTHLWHHTSLKAFRSAIKDRYDAVKNLDARFTNRRANLAFAAFVWTSGLFIWYTFGAFDPLKAFKEVMPYECNRTDMGVCKPEENKTKKSACPPAQKKPC